MARRFPVYIKAVRYALMAVLVLMLIDCENAAIAGKTAANETTGSARDGTGYSDKVDDEFMSRRLADPVDDNRAVKEQQYFEAVNQGRALINERGALVDQKIALITQENKLKDRKIELLQGSQGADEQQLGKIDQQLKVLDQQITQKSAQVQVQSAKVLANDGFIKAIKEVMRDARFKAAVDPAEFIQDLYDWRMKKYPAKAKSRYISERDMLLNELNDRLATEKLQAQERARQGLPPDPPISGNNFSP